MEDLEVKKLKRKLQRLKARKLQLQLEHGGNEMNCTYHGGFTLGYVTGQVSEIENCLDILGFLDENKN